jgi:hypothetical protein
VDICKEKPSISSTRLPSFIIDIISASLQFLEKTWIRALFLAGFFARIEVVAGGHFWRSLASLRFIGR